MGQYFLTGFILALVFAVFTGLILKKAFEAYPETFCDDDEKQQFAIITLVIVAILMLLGWPVFVPLWILIVIVGAIYGYMFAKKKDG
jgi:ABC-type antimicrobial peptide transport system permease subunit